MRTFLSFVLLGLVGCGSVGNKADPDAAVKMDAAIDGAVMTMPDAAALGSQANPATSCVALKNAGATTSGLYYLKDANGTAFQTYCEQVENGGGWALVYRSVGSAAGTTTAFWQFTYSERLARKGSPAVGSNFYEGAVYRLGLEYMDTITDLQDKTAVVMTANTSGILVSSMRFQDPVMTSGSTEIYLSQLANGWSSSDHDDDPYSGNCAVFYANVAQHYTSCFVYGLGARGDAPYEDAGWGPHLRNQEIAQFQLYMQPSSAMYSRVNAISRYARW
jgi:hypothetical protein